MKIDLSTKTVCVVDHGPFTEVAVLLAQKFGRTLLYTPWEGRFPKSQDIRIGEGLEGVEKIDSMWPHVDEVDLWVFPDIHFGPLQDYLASIGKRVWGSRTGEELELDRVLAKEVMLEVGLSVGKYAVVTGIKALREYLKANDSQYVKVSRSRGDFETFKSEDYELSEPQLDELAHRLGALADVTDFVVEAAIPDAVEIGYDGFTVDGDFPSVAMCGIEVKDKAYVGHFTEYSKMAAPIHEVNDALAGALEAYKFRNFFCVETRVTKDGKAWVIDPCARMGSPPSQLAMLMYENLAEIFWHGAGGELVDPVPAGKWGAQVMLVSPWAKDNWLALDFPAEIRKNVKLQSPMVIDGRYHVPPLGYDEPVVGAVVAVGNTMEAAIEEVKRLVPMVRGYLLEASVSSFDDAGSAIEKLKKFGLEL